MNAPVTGPAIYRDMTGIEAALAEFGSLARPWRASCTVCNGFHTAAADEVGVLAPVLRHIAEDHQLVSVRNVGQL